MEKAREKNNIIFEEYANYLLKQVEGWENSEGISEEKIKELLEYVAKRIHQKE